MPSSCEKLLKLKRQENECHFTHKYNLNFHVANGRYRCVPEMRLGDR